MNLRVVLPELRSLAGNQRDGVIYVWGFLLLCSDIHAAGKWLLKSESSSQKKTSESEIAHQRLWQAVSLTQWSWYFKCSRCGSKFSFLAVLHTVVNMEAERRPILLG